MPESKGPNDSSEVRFIEQSEGSVGRPGTGEPWGSAFKVGGFI